MTKTAEMWRQGLDGRDTASMQNAVTLLQKSLQTGDWFSECISDVLEQHESGRIQTPTDLKMYIERVEGEFQRNLQTAREFWRQYRALVEQSEDPMPK
jgi:hypothetical protein